MRDEGERVRDIGGGVREEWQGSRDVVLGRKGEGARGQGGRMRDLGEGVRGLGGRVGEGVRGSRDEV